MATIKQLEAAETDSGGLTGAVAEDPRDMYGDADEQILTERAGASSPNLDGKLGKGLQSQRYSRNSGVNHSRLDGMISTPGGM